MMPVLLGHWFLQHDGGVKDGRTQLLLMAGSVTAVAAWDVAWSLSGGPRHHPLRHPAIWVGLGFAAGGLCWSQSW